MSDRSIHFIVNPRAGNGRQAMHLVERTVRSGRGRIWVLQREEGIAAAVGRALADGATEVVAVGGDGTVGAVAGALAGGPAVLGIVPAGTANMFARELGLPLTLYDSLDLVMGRHDVRHIDIMVIGGRGCVHQILIGAGSIALSKVTPMRKWLLRRFVYAITALRMLRDPKPMRVRADMDGSIVEGYASHVIIANSGILGINPLRLGTGIRVDDGEVEIMLIRGRGRTSLFLAAVQLVTGEHGIGLIDHYRARDMVLIGTEPPTAVRADGEIIGRTPISIKVLPSAVGVMVPKRR